MTLSNVTLDRDDVFVEKLEPKTCDDCTGLARRVVSLDARGLGTTIPVGIYCAKCAKEVVKRLRATLPKRERYTRGV